MSSDEGMALATLQGREDAAWLPTLADELLDGGALYDARQSGYGEYGDAAGNVADRQAKTRLIDGLVASGLARRVSRRVELTPKGSRIARSYCWDFKPETLIEAVDRINAATANDGYMVGPCGEKWIPESRIAGSLESEKVDALQVLLLPLIRAKLIESGTTVNGRVFYRLLGEPISRKQIAELIDLEAGKKRFRDNLADVHWRELQTTREKIIRRYDGGEIGPIPIVPTPMHDGKKHDDIAGIKSL